MAVRAVLSPEDLEPEVLGPILGTEVSTVEVRQTATTLAGAFAFVSLDMAAADAVPSEQDLAIPRTE